MKTRTNNIFGNHTYLLDQLYGPKEYMLIFFFFTYVIEDINCVSIIDIGFFSWKLAGSMCLCLKSRCNIFIIQICFFIMLNCLFPLASIVLIFQTSGFNRCLFENLGTKSIFWVINFITYIIQDIDCVDIIDISLYLWKISWIHVFMQLYNQSGEWMISQPSKLFLLMLSYLFPLVSILLFFFFNSSD